MYSPTMPCTAMMTWMRPVRRMMAAACRPPASPPAANEAKREMPTAAASATPADIIDTALAAGSFNKLISAVIASGLGQTLKSSGPFTVFAPGDAAFAQLPAGALTDLLKPENLERLKALLTFHVVPGRLSASDLANVQTLTTVSGKSLPVRVEISGLAGSEFRGMLQVNGARVARADIACTNGVIHVIDRVLIPAE